MDDAGFERVTRLSDARERLRAACARHGRRTECPVPDAPGRVLAADVRAQRDVPHYDRAAMDGYAVRAADTFDATGRSPARLEVRDGAGTAGPGDDASGPAVEADAPVEPGTARQVHTGSPAPDGADAVVKVERTERDGDVLLVHEAVAVGENVAPAGEDVSEGEALFDAGRRLRPSDLALLRSTGVESVTVAERPRVAVVPTGDEVVAPGADPEPGEVVGTNGLLVSRLAESWGARASERDVVPDDADALRAALERAAADADLVATTGGSSVGERDLLPEVLADCGELLVHGLAIEPGHPAGFGHVEGTPVLLLPGYPVSCLIAAVQLLRPAVAWTAGAEPEPIPSVPAVLSEKLPSAPGERTFARVRFAGDAADGTASDDSDLPRTAPVRVGGAGVVSSVAAADGWVVVPESREGIPAGERVAVQRWE